MDFQPSLSSPLSCLGDRNLFLTSSYFGAILLQQSEDVFTSSHQLFLCLQNCS